jgi:hypothetical protein
VVGAKLLLLAVPKVLVDLVGLATLTTLAILLLVARLIILIPRMLESLTQT